MRGWFPNKFAIGKIVMFKLQINHLEKKSKSTRNSFLTKSLFDHGNHVISLNENLHGLRLLADFFIPIIVGNFSR